MAVDFGVSTRGMRETLRNIGDMEARLRDLSPVLKGGAEGLRETIDDAFEASTTPWGEPWLELAEETIEEKRRLGRSLKPLIRRGHMRNRITARSQKQSIVFGWSPTTPYGLFHQEGMGVPQRVFLPRGEDDMRGPVGSWRDKLLRRVERYVITGKK